MGQIFTPDYVTDLILDDIGYTHNHIIDKKIMEPSFGKGVFLLHILRRLILECETLNFSREDTIKQIQNNIYGIEIDEECYNETIERINGFLRGLGFQNIKLNLFLQDTLQWNKFGMFDYVVGNPPYIRIHNLDEKNRAAIKDFEFSKGMADLYIIFFEVGLRMLNRNGKLGYITPNSYLTNSSQKNFRKYLLEKNLLQIIENYGSWKVFENFDTYTCITILNKNKDNALFNYSSIEGIKRKYITTYDNDCFKIGNEWTGDAWNLTSQENIDFLNSVKTRTQTISDYGTVQCGIATNKDNVYIVKDIQDTKKKSVKIFNGSEIESKLLKKIVKGSKYHGSGNYWILFPYKQNEKDGSISVIEEDEMRKKYPLAYNYFLAHEEELLKRDMDSNAKTWYQFARSQGLNNCFKKKIVINHILPDNSQQAEVYELDEETLVYSGIYITAENDEKLNFIKDELQSSDFAKYAVLCGKDMSGGYKKFNTNIVKNYNMNLTGLLPVFHFCINCLGPQEKI